VESVDVKWLYLYIILDTFDLFKLLQKKHLNGSGVIDSTFANAGISALFRALVAGVSQAMH